MVHHGPLLVVTVTMEFMSQFFYLIHPLFPPVIIQLRNHLGYSRIPTGYEADSVNNAQFTVVNNSNADFDKPILSNYTVTPSSVDISSGTQTLTLNITASDASGVVTPTSSAKPYLRLQLYD